MKKEERKLRSITGHKAKYMGELRVKAKVQRAQGRTVDLNVGFSCMDVFRPILAAKDAFEQGKSMWFTPDQGCGVCRALVLRALSRALEPVRLLRALCRARAESEAKENWRTRTVNGE